MASINKDKIAETAQKYLKKNQFSKAIAELKKIVDADPSDMRYWKKIGDIQVRAGDKDGAVETYLKVSDDFTKQGFYSKALAILQQIQSMDPNIPEVYLKLADVYIATEFTPDALYQLEKLCRIYENKGDIDNHLIALNKMADIDPSKVIHRVHLAETYSKLGRKREAAQNFSKVADFLFAEGKDSDFIKVAERLLWHDPDDAKVIKRLANAYLKVGNSQKIMKRLLQIYQNNPDDTETLHLLARVFMDSDKKEKAVFVYKELAKLHSHMGKNDEAEAIYKRILEIDEDDPDARKFIYGEQEISNIEEISGVEEISGIEEMPGEDSDVHEMGDDLEEIEEDDLIMMEESKENEDHKLLDESEAFLRYGLVEKAVDNLKIISNKDSERFFIVSKEIAVKKGQKNEALELLKRLSNLSFNTDRKKSGDFASEALEIEPGIQWAMDIINSQTARNKPMTTMEIAATLDLDEALDMLDEIGAPGDSMESELLLDESWTTQAQVHSDDEIKEAISKKDSKPVEDQFSDDEDFEKMLVALKGLTTGEIPVYDDDSLVDDEDSDSQNDIVLDTSHFGVDDFSMEMDELADLQEASQSFIRIRELSQDEIRLDSMHSPQPQIEVEESSLTASAIPEIDDNEAFDDFNFGVFEEPSGKIEAPAATSEKAPGEFGFEPTLDSYEKLMNFSERVKSELSGFEHNEDTGSEKEAPSKAILTPEPVPLSDEALEALNEIDFFIETDLIDDALAAAQELFASNPHPDVKAKLKQVLELIGADDEEEHTPVVAIPNIPEAMPGRTSNAEPDISEFEPDIELNLGELSSDENLDLNLDLNLDFNEEEVTAIQGLDLLKSGIPENASRVEESVRIETGSAIGDANTHFDLGLAYKEMGLTNQAIEEFKHAMESPGAKIKSMIMISKCHLELGEKMKASNELKAALHSDSINPDEELDIYFELGKIYLEMNDKEEASYYLKKVVRKDPDYRGVNKLLTEL
ncbi:tetratricopeptide repeat protein [Myxococcota bacterium]|nr:tetratricopeptide repeat protein [Myxococcota bacterium]MBU1381329.1 tetratricopeptide repeat protein [Myxococcota bacterium]MBU1495706.1 tetratricopeptide repeat protein [Myxococcota bacterium]